MLITTRLILGVAIIAAFAPPADAQMLRWEDRGYFTFSLGIQPQSREFTQTSTPEIYRENALISVPHSVSSGVFTDVSAGVRVWQNLAVGLGFSHFSDTEAPTLTAQIPNPLLFGQPRPASQSSGELDRSESAIHVQLMWVLPVSNKIELAAFGGPSFFRVKQGFATLSQSDIVEGPFPFATVTISKVTTASARESTTGFNLGVDGTYLVLTRWNIKWGAGGFIRFSGASTDFSAPGGGTLKLDAGGLQIGGGLRARF